MSTDRDFGQGSFALAGRGLPLHPVVSVDRHNMLVSLIGGIVVLMFYRIDTRRDNHRNIGGVLGDGIVDRLTVISSVDCELRDRYANLIELWLHLRGLAGILLRHDMSDYIAAVSIQRQILWRKPVVGLAQHLRTCV